MTKSAYELLRQVAEEQKTILQEIAAIKRAITMGEPLERSAGELKTEALAGLLRGDPRKLKTYMAQKGNDYRAPEN